MLLDMDRFKQINDTHGHSAGDQVLKHFAELLRGATRDYRPAVPAGRGGVPGGAQAYGGPACPADRRTHPHICGRVRFSLAPNGHGQWGIKKPHTGRAALLLCWKRPTSCSTRPKKWAETRSWPKLIRCPPVLPEVNRFAGGITGGCASNKNRPWPPQAGSFCWVPGFQMAFGGQPSWHVHRVTCSDKLMNFSMPLLLQMASRAC